MARKSPSQHVDELREEPLVHVPRHLVQHLKKETRSRFFQAYLAHQPVPDGAVLDVVANRLVVLRLDEVAPNLPLQQLVPEDEYGTYVIMSILRICAMMMMTIIMVMITLMKKENMVMIVLTVLPDAPT